MTCRVIWATALLLLSAVGCSGKGRSASGTGGASSGGRGGSDGSDGFAGGGGAGGLGAPLPDPCRGAALPLDEHYVPPGLCARTVATGQGTLRQIVFSSNGDLWGATDAGPIKRFRDSDGDGAFQAGEIITWATTGGNGQNVHIDEAGEDVLVNQPTSGHGKHTVHVWDGWMYVQSGSADNVINPKAPSYDDQRSLIKRFDLARFSTGKPFDWAKDGEIFADGLRNVLGFNRDASGRIYGVQNGQDDVTYGGVDVHDDNPGEVIVRLTAGSHHGYPFCFVAQRIAGIAPGIQVHSAIFGGNTHDDAWCQDPANAAPPATFFQAHSAPMDIIFFTGPSGALPERWRGGAFVSLHGSWDRTPPTGYRVVWVPFAPDGTAPLPTNAAGTTAFPYEPVLSGGDASGSRDGDWSVTGGEHNVRPVGVAVSPVDGALYVSSDSQGYLYRVGLQR